ncbi:unnamed protein product [Chrysoparadoxa australica]
MARELSTLPSTQKNFSSELRGGCAQCVMAYDDSFQFSDGKDHLLLAVEEQETAMRYERNETRGRAGHEQGWWLSALCLNIDKIKPFFNVTDDVVAGRIKKSLWKGNLVCEELDLWGPIWITLTVIFALGASANALSWALHDGNLSSTWAYDFKLLVKSLTLMTTYTFGASAALKLGSAYFSSLSETPTQGFSAVQSISLIGYSLAALVPASLLCCIPLPYLPWLMLLLGVATGGALLEANLRHLIVAAGPRKAQNAHLALAFMQMSLWLLLNLTFY